MRTLKERVAFITGAASGIGFGIASALAAAGTKTMLCDIDEGALARAVGTLRDDGGDVEGVVADVSCRGDLERAAEETARRFEKVHVLVNNAGVGGAGIYPTWSRNGWDWTLEVNLHAAIDGIQIFGPMIEDHGEGGHIVSTASFAGLHSASSAPYNVSKYGIVALSEGLRVELAPRGIGVSVLCPGIIRTNIVDTSLRVPERFVDDVADARGPSAEEMSAFLAMFRQRIDGGLDPRYVGELVREGIEEDWDYIFTETDWEPLIDARFAAIKAAYDRIRDRVPQRG